jgi:AcrR family transcriptional regulator
VAQDLRDPPNRRREVLAAALELLADEGYAGASLRKVAAKVGIAQPSLYHYFRTKEELVEQVLAAYAGDMFFALDVGALPKRLDAVPAFIADTTRRVYQLPNHAQFVRVAFAVSRVNPRFGKLMRTIFVDQANMGMRGIMQPFIAAGEIEEADAVDLVRMVVSAIGLRFMEEFVLFDDAPPSRDIDRYVQFVVDAAETMLRSLKRRRT